MKNFYNGGMNHQPFTLMEKIKKSVGEPSFPNQEHFNLLKLAEYFNSEEDPSNYIRWKDENERSELYYLFNNISERLKFISYLHRKVLLQFKGRFTTQQLTFILQAYNGVMISYEDKVDIGIRGNLLDHIENEGNNFDLGDIDAFKSKIESINSFEFEIFVNLILESWNAGRIDEMLSSLQMD